MDRRFFTLMPIVALLSSCGLARTPSAQSDSAPAAVRNALAPTGKLRVAVLPGSPSSMVRDPATGEGHGVAFELGRELALRLEVEVQVVEYPAFSTLATAIGEGKADFASFSADSELATGVLLTPVLFTQESGYLVRGELAAADMASLDREGIRIGVQANSSSQAKLSTTISHAKLVPLAQLQQVPGMLARGELDAFATNKAILYDMADRTPGARVLSGHYAEERTAIAIPPGREAALPYLDRFVREALRTGLVAGAADRARLRGVTFSQGT